MSIRRVALEFIALGLLAFPLTLAGVALFHLAGVKDTTGWTGGVSALLACVPLWVWMVVRRRLLDHALDTGG